MKRHFVVGKERFVRKRLAVKRAVVVEPCGVFPVKLSGRRPLLEFDTRYVG